MKTSDERTIRSIIKATETSDPFFPERQYSTLQTALSEEWSRRVVAIEHSLASVYNNPSRPDKSDISKVLSVLDKQFNSNSFKTAVDGAFRSAITPTFQRANREAVAEAHDQGVAQKDDGDLLQQDIIQETDALEALVQQGILSVGGFWDDRLSESIKTELQSWFEGDLPREDEFKDGKTIEGFNSKLKALVEDKLKTSGKSLPASYFDQLSHQMIVRTRTIGKFTAASNLGAIGYIIQNPMDHRTESICKGIVKKKLIYTLAGADAIIKDIIAANSTDDLKNAYAFFTSENDTRHPVPPLHFPYCRSWMLYIYNLQQWLSEGYRLAA